MRAFSTIAVIALITLVSVGIGVGLLNGQRFGAPTSNGVGARFERTLLPELDSTYELGTSTKAWLRANLDILCLTGDTCRTTWPTGGGSGTISTSTQPSISNLAFWTTSGAFPELLGTVATTTLTASSPLSLSNTVAKVGGSNSVLTIDTSGAWSGTAGSLAANGANCSAGNFPLGVDALGAVESCTDAWTEAENTTAAYTPQSRTLTVAGTSNQITSSAGAQDLTANRTWTLSLPNLVVFPGNASTTQLTVSSTATSTWIVGNEEVWGMVGVGRTATTTIRGDNATSTFANAVTATGLNVDTYIKAPFLTSALVLTGSAGDFAEYTGTTCTNQFVRVFSALGVATCETVSLTADVTGDLPFSNLAQVSANSVLGNVTGATADAASVATTSLYTGSNGQVLTRLNGLWQGVATTTFSDGVVFSAGNVTSNLTAGDGLTRNTDDFDCDVASGSIPGCLSSTDWTTFNNSLDTYDAFTHVSFAGQTTSATSTLIRITATPLSFAATSTYANFATTTQLTVGTYGSNVGTYFTDDGDGALTIQGIGNNANESLTLNFDDVANTVDVTSATGVSTFDFNTLIVTAGAILANANDGGALGASGTAWSDLFLASGGIINWSAGDVTLTHSAGLLTLSASDGFTMTGAFINSDGSLEIPNGTGPTVDTTGEIGVDTTSGQFKWSYNNATLGIKMPYETLGFGFASSTQGAATTTLRLGPAPFALTVTSVQCDFSNFMGVSLYDGTNRANYLVASSTIGTVTYSTNNTFTAGEAFRVDVGTSTNIAASVSGGCTFKYTPTAD